MPNTFVGLALTLLVAARVVDRPISLDGIGAIRVGATVAAAARAAGEPLVNPASTPAGDGCHYVRLASAPSILFMVESGRIVRVETRDQAFRTVSGARVGDTEVRVRALYGKRLEVTRHKYDENGRYFIVRSADRRRALVLETDGKIVVFIRAGLLPAAEYVEGCL
jgi:hypothetical protein